MWVGSLSKKEPLEKEMETHSRILGLVGPMDREVWWATIHGGHKESDITEVTEHTDGGYQKQQVCWGWKRMVDWRNVI